MEALEAGIWLGRKHAFAALAGHCSAAGDGTTDDTHAIPSALDNVGAVGGGVVLVPAGTHLLKQHLVMPAVTALAGVARAPRMCTDKSPGSKLLAVEGVGDRGEPAFLTLAGPNSTLEGIAVFQGS